MLVVKAVYDRGQIRLLEPVPLQIAGPQEVTVTFAEVKVVPISQVALKRQQAKEATLALFGLLNTLSVEQMKAFDMALQRTQFLGTREIAW